MVNSCLHDKVISFDRLHVSILLKREQRSEDVEVACYTTGLTVRLYFGAKQDTHNYFGTGPSLSSQGDVYLSLRISSIPTDHHSYLEPTEPDDQEVDYDNIWEYDCDTGMIQPTSGISTHWTGLDFGARGLGAMATQQRWS